jgi:hypothetical protein
VSFQRPLATFLEVVVNVTTGQAEDRSDFLGGSAAFQLSGGGELLEDFAFSSLVRARGSRFRAAAKARIFAATSTTRVVIPDYFKAMPFR